MHMDDVASPSPARARGAAAVDAMDWQSSSGHQQPHSSRRADRGDAEFALLGYDPSTEDILVKRQRGGLHHRPRTAREDIANADVVGKLAELNVQAVAAKDWAVPERRQMEIEEGRSAQSVATSDNMFILTMDPSSKAVTSKQSCYPTGWPRLCSPESIRRFKRRFSHACQDGFAQCLQGIRDSSDPLRQRHLAEKGRNYKDNKCAIAMFVDLLEKMLLKASMRRTPAEQWAYYQQIFKYSYFCLYCARVDKAHELVVDRHDDLWELAEFYEPPTAPKELRDPFAAAFKAQILGSGAGRSRSARQPSARSSTAAPQRRAQPSRSSNAASRSSTTTARSARRSTSSATPAARTRGPRVPEHMMVGAPPSVSTALAGRCLTCGGAHMANRCPAKSVNGRTADQRRAVAATLREVQQVRKKRSDWMDAARDRM